MANKPVNPTRPTGKWQIGSRAKLQLLNAVVFMLFNIIYAGLLLATNDRIGGPLLMFMIAAATLGAAVFESTKVNSIPDSAPFAPLLVNWFWKLFVSGILAVFVYAVFAGGIVQGALFPAFSLADVSFVDMESFLRDIKPKTNSDVAKALVWSFIAGYSQRFVPNLFEQLDRSSEESISQRRAKDDGIIEAR